MKSEDQESWIAESVPELHIAIGTSPAGGDPKVAIANDIELLKPALLYADKVTLLSPAATMIQAIAEIPNVDRRGRIKALSGIASMMPDELRDELDSLLAQVKALRAKRMGKTRAEILGQQHLESYFDDLWEKELPPVIQSTIDLSDAEQLLRIIREGIVTLEPVLDKSRTLRSDRIVDIFVEKLDDLLRRPGSIPLFDDQTGGIVRSGVEEGWFTPTTHGLSQMTEVASASGFMKKLPTFPQATVDEILDIRKELDAPLVRFRGAMAEMSKDFNSLSYDVEFQSEVDSMYRGRIAPALLELDELIESTRVFSQFRAAATQDVKGYITSGLLLVGMIQSGSAAWEAVLTSVGTAAMSSGAVAAWSRRKTISASQQHPLYLLYQTEKELRSR